MKKSDGSWTYFGADAAYHLQKAESANHLINIWGADHAGTVKRVQAAVRALTDGRVDLDVKIVNMVRLFRAGEPIKMSKRSEEHTSELQSLMRISYAVFCVKKKKIKLIQTNNKQKT